MNPLVSIVTPTYNHEQFIGECIESVLAQTYDNWEMIIVDDGSADRTWEIAQQYAARDHRIQIFHQENKGIWRLAETYNFALGQSRGELVAVLEGDDIWMPSKLDIQVPFHLGGGYTLTFGQIRTIKTSGVQALGKIYPDSKQYSFLNQSDPDELFLRLLRGEYFTPAVTVMISRRQLVEINGFKQPHYLPLVDYPTWLSIGLTFGGFGYIPEILACWRQHSSQTTWLLARDIARGVYQFAYETALTEKFNLNLETVDLRNYLLSKQRRSFLADASYRAAAVSFERGSVKQALSYCTEIVKMRDYSLFTRCLAMFSWKFTRKLVKTISLI